MRLTRTWLALWGTWLLLSCSAPEALSSAGTRESVFAEEESLEARPPGPMRGPVVRTPENPGRGVRRRQRNPFEPRERVFNEEPTPQQREAARRRMENAAAERTLVERYWKRKAEAEQKYPEKVGLYQEHHSWPLYLGGPRNGQTYRLPADYHQLITNAFRRLHPYGQPRPSAERAQEIIREVYLEYPIPQLIGIPNP
jgi:hypothetical protein